MTPQLQQAIKLLTLSNLEIETFVTDALEANPLLENGGAADGGAADEGVTGETSEPVAVSAEDAGADELIGAGLGEADQPLDLAQAGGERDFDTGDGSLLGMSGEALSGGGMAEDGFEESRASAVTLADHLSGQIGAVCPDERTAFVARHIIGLLDEAGYLHTPLRHVAGELGASEALVETALACVQSLDPTGVGARDLAECIALQAKEADRYDPCMERLIANLDLVAKGDVARLRRLCSVDEEDFADMLRELRSYDPRPGLQYGGDQAGAVTPDILIRHRGGEDWDIALNEATLPRLVVNRGYYLELRASCADKSGRAWLSEKLGDANWLIKALDQRQKTILKVAAELVKQQSGFFLHGVSRLRPLTLREVADAIDMHESTVSRVTTNKFLMCERGTFELKFFFSSGVGSADGDGSGASAEAIKARIRALTDAEDPKKILSDDALVDALKAEGFDLARRTVAKYREAIGIGSSVQRRRAKKMGL
jgi:RNA polymerase sigma-54 factor